MDSQARTNVYHVTYTGESGICSLFFWGCNFLCRICLLKKEAYDCHLPENRLRIYDPVYTSSTPERFLSIGELIDLLSPVALSRVFLMGAEPLCDPLLPAILQYLKEERSSSLTLLTNGYNPVPTSLVDEVVLSIKAITPSLHLDYTGKDNKPVLQAFERMAREKRVRLYAETVLIPGYVDADEVEAIAAYIASVDPSIPFRIDAYLPIPGLPWRAPGASELEALRDKVKAILPHTTCFYGAEGEIELAYEVDQLF